MSDRMYPMGFARLMTWILTENREKGQIFGVTVAKAPREGALLPIFGETLAAPFGPAAGPHTQLAQNIVAAYVSGARFFELKTVQIMDGEELSQCVAKPCIAAGDECYNCEWSTELTVPQAFEEYVRAWFACKLLSRELDLGDPDGFVFNMSVGYDLKGIQSPKIDGYIEGMKDASATPVWQECLDWTLANLDRFRRVDEGYVRAVSPKISRSITLSTLHGCPAGEIEAIAAYLIGEKGLHTYVKCNPTLLGYDFARRTLDSLGWDYVSFDDHHFNEDLQMADAVPMFRRLEALAEEGGVEFGVKLSNTFPVEVRAGELPAEEMYMSGRALLPLTLSLAEQLSRTFEGKLRISYSGGADAATVRDLVAAGVWPVTMATTVLKPGGYERFAQIGELLEGAAKPWTGVDVPALSALAEQVRTGEMSRKPVKALPVQKLPRQVPLLDCFTAPCHETCPIHQDIPAYLELVEEGRYLEALQVITARNALPFITGTICPHPCAGACMRGHYEEGLHIRQAKLKAAQSAFQALLGALPPKGSAPGVKAAIVGGGPAGMAAAFYLSRAGARVTLFEKGPALGGVVRRAIPGFRIPEEAVDNDAKLIAAYGADIRLNTPAPSVEELRREGYTHILLAVGAWAPGKLPLEGDKALDALQFLADIKAGKLPRLGSHVAVIGGGNTAMDTARAAKRLPGVESVCLVYRRDVRNMPADREELDQALADGVLFHPLLSPERFRDGELICRVMALGEPDASGRRTPKPTHEIKNLRVDAVIAAVGQGVETAFLRQNGVELDPKGRPATDGTGKAAPGLYLIGDAQKGPKTVVEAQSDALLAAEDILGHPIGEPAPSVSPAPDREKLTLERGKLEISLEKRGNPNLCLRCAALCETCVSVCPNRANVAVTVPGMGLPQILHVDGMCNECGNCAVFCPYDSRPYKDKFTLFRSREDLENSENQGFLPLGDHRALVRFAGRVTEYNLKDNACGLYDPLRKFILAVLEGHPYLLP